MRSWINPEDDRLMLQTSVTTAFRQLLVQQKQGNLAISLPAVREAIDMSPPTAAEAQQVIQLAAQHALEASGWSLVGAEQFCRQSPALLQPGHSWHSEAVHVRALADLPDLAILVIQPGVCTLARLSIAYMQHADTIRIR